MNNLRAAQSMKRGSSSPNCPDRPWDPRSLLRNGYRVLLSPEVNRSEFAGWSLTFI